MRKAITIPLRGHPDLVCDQIADAIVDEYLRRDPQSRVAVTVLGAHGMAMVGGEVESKADFDISAFVRAVYKDIGYGDELEVFANIERPTHLAPRGTSHGFVVVHGYATAETRERLPRPLVHARLLSRDLHVARTTDPLFAWLRPDGDIGVVCESGNVKQVSLRVSHREDIALRDVQTALFERVRAFLGTDASVTVNATGAFTIDGFRAMSGGSGRQTVSSTYGGLVPSGSVPFSGLDPWHPARAGTVAARAAARALVDQGLVQAAQVTVGYEPGRAEPAFVRASGAGVKARGVTMDVTDAVCRDTDFRSEAIVERFDLARPLYRDRAAWGIE